MTNENRGALLYMPDKTLCVLVENEILSSARIKRAVECLKDNGVDADEADTVLQALCYILLDTEVEELF